jgi:hypothetical protein
VNGYQQYRLLQHAISDRHFPIGLARVEIDAGAAGRIIADMTSGDCRMEIFEEDPTGIYLFGVDRPVRTLHQPRRIRMEIDALFEQMTVTLPPQTERER